MPSTIGKPTLGERLKKLRASDPTAYAQFALRGGGTTDTAKLEKILDDVLRDMREKNVKALYDTQSGLFGRPLTDVELSTAYPDSEDYKIAVKLRDAHIVRRAAHQYSRYQSRMNRPTGRQFLWLDIDDTEDEDTTANEAEHYNPNLTNEDTNVDPTRAKYARVKEPTILLKRDGLWFLSPYNADAVAAIKLLPTDSRAWNAQQKCWVLSANRAMFLALVDISTKHYGTKPQMAAEEGLSIQDVIEEKLVDRSSYYTLLGISEQATQEEIKKGYRKLAFKFHPDQNKGMQDDAFILVKQAYETLSDPQKRKRYDAARRMLRHSNKG